MSGAARRLATGLTGLNVVKEPQDRLVRLYSKTLRLLNRMPADAGYRQNTEAIVKSRLHLVQAEKDIPALERKINCGLIEEVIVQAERELQLARNMILWKPWEPLVAEAPKNQWRWPLA